MNRSSLHTHANVAVIEAAYERWLQNPDSVDPTWRAFFQGFTLGSNGASPAAALASGTAPANATAPIIDSLKQSHVHQLINAYRSIGHLEAQLDPLSDPPAGHPKLSLDQFDLSEADLDTSFDVGTYLGGGQMKLRDVLGNLRLTYCDHVGVEYTHIQDVDVRRWLQERMESTRNQPDFSKTEKIRILRRVHKAELFERFLHTKYVGQKRFSLEGGETMVAAVDSIIEHCPTLGVEEVVIGMAHRGRLNILTSVMRKNFDILFEQFSENYIPDAVGGDGDVKYHLGHEAVLDTATGQKIEVRLAANPSHLEIVDPVVEGKAGRLTKGDVLAASAAKAADVPAAVAKPAVVAAPPAASWGSRQTRRKMSPLRQKIAQRLVAAQHEAAMLTTFNEVDMSAVMALRAKYQDDFVKKNGLKLGFMSFFAKAVVHALKEVPAVNAQLEGDSIIENHFYDLGIAVSTDKGLMVPVIRGCDTLGMADIEKAIGDVAKRARESKITLGDLEGGVFTITNGGTFGSMLSTPIINPPQSAILGLHAINDRPVAVNGQVVIRPMMYLALSYDHRLIDGKEAVTFLVKVKQAIEDPTRLILGV